MTMPSLLQSLAIKTQYFTYAARARVMKSLRQYAPRKSIASKLIVFDPALVGFNGHHVEFARLLQAEFAATSDISFYVNFRASTRLIASLGAQPVCYDTMYPPSPSSLASRRSFESLYAEMTRSMIESLKKIDTEDLNSETIMLIHTATLYQLGGLARWFTDLPAAKRPKLFLQFHFPLEFRISPDDRQWARSLAKEAVTILRGAGTVRFASTSQPLSQNISEALDCPCVVMPLPVKWPDMTKISPPLPGIIFGFFGGLRTDKGAGLLANAIPDFVRRYPDARFIVHAPPVESDETAVRILAQVPQVQLIQKNFRRKDLYLANFCKARCILAPYNPAIYALQISGIFLEALGLGRLIITTEGTTMEAELRERQIPAIMMRSFTAKDLAECLDAARRHLLDERSQPSPNEEVISTHSAPAYCKALMDVMQD